MSQEPAEVVERPGAEAPEGSPSPSADAPPLSEEDSTVRERRLLKQAFLVSAGSAGTAALWVTLLFPALFGRTGPVTLPLKLAAWGFTAAPLLLALLVLAGFLLPRRKLLGGTLILILAAVSLELGARLHTGFEKAGLVLPHGKRGWAAPGSAQWNGPVPGFGHVRFTTNPDGFRRFGDRHTSKTKVLILGDSYTQAHGISEGETYFDRLAELRPDLEVFAYGCMGYGSLQEYLALDEYLDLVRPDVILWQFCHNDLVNNSARLEAASLAQNNHVERPYWERGAIRWRYPRSGGVLPGWVVARSHFLRGWETRRDLRLALTQGTIEPSLSPDHPLYRESAEATSAVMALVRRRAGTIPIYSFAVETPPWTFDLFESVSRANGITYLPEVPRAIDAARAAGQKMDAKPADAHWNAAAHRLAAEVMAGELLRNYE